MTLWNPTVHTVVQHLRVPVTKNYLIRDPNGRAILADVSEIPRRKEPKRCSFIHSFKFIPISDPTKKLPGRKSFATFELVFNVILPPLGYNTYYFEGKPSSDVVAQENGPCVLQNQVSPMGKRPRSMNSDVVIELSSGIR